jgi:cation diffusion facilitator family transporter
MMHKWRRRPSAAETPAGTGGFEADAERLAAASIAVALLVMAIKYAAAAMTGSVALLSDALESIVNVIASAAAWWAIRVSRQPADREHQHGHHKAEYFSAVLEGVLIVLAALAIGYEAWRAWLVPRAIDTPLEGLALNAVATAINFGWAANLLRTGRRGRSPALIADGRHIMADVATSLGVLAGLGAALATGWQFLDPLLALLVAVNILNEGRKVIGSSVHGLMDSAVLAGDDARIREIISREASGAIEVHDLKTRIAGRAIFAEFHLVVDAGMPVGAAHAICDRIERALESAYPGIRATIHVEPDDEAKLPRGTTAVPFA